MGQLGLSDGGCPLFSLDRRSSAALYFPLNIRFASKLESLGLLDLSLGSLDCKAMPSFVSSPNRLVAIAPFFSQHIILMWSLVLDLLLFWFLEE